MKRSYYKKPANNKESLIKNCLNVKKLQIPKILYVKLSGQNGDGSKICGFIVSDVGDGLCLTFCDPNSKVIQVDCGNQRTGKIAYDCLQEIRRKFDPKIFVLSHFHSDHYNGLVYGLQNISKSRFNFKRVYYPRIPKFDNDKELFYALSTMNIRILGEKTGVMSADLLSIINKLNNYNPPKGMPLSKGDKIEDRFKVLWPPCRLKDGLLLKSVKSALKDFNIALEEDEITREIYNSIRERRFFERYNYDESFEEDYELNKRFIYQEIPDIVRNANKSLRNVANRLSLVFSKNKDFLFFGDLEKHEIRKVVKDLRDNNKLNYISIITPHHGTHWQNNLKNINCIYAVASCGKKLVDKIKYEYKDISEIFLVTQVNGEIIIPSYKITSQLLKDIVTKSRIFFH